MALLVPDRDDWFDETAGFPRPDWGAVHGWMRVFAGEADANEAWQQVARHWLGRLRAALGENYALAESANFHLLSAQEPVARSRTLEFLERARSQIHRILGDISPKGAVGKHALIRFSDTERYYAYISHFHADGTYAGSSGMFLRDGYQHVAYPQSWSADEERRTVVHELTHNLLAHLPLPPWLNEALAMAFETDIGGGGHEPLTRELAARHREYWNAATIQAFWRGESFGDVDGQELAYSLSRILLNLIHTEVRPPQEEFRRFVLRSDWGDAGRSAAREHLGIELADLAACFLGEGDWTPEPKTWRRRPEHEDDVEAAPAPFPGDER